MAVIRQAHQVVAVKVCLFDPLHLAVILEENLELQPGVVLFQAILQMPLALPCAASMNPSGRHLEEFVLLYKSVLYRMCSGLSLTFAFAKSPACWERACWERAPLTVQARASSSKVIAHHQRAGHMVTRQRTRLALDALVLKYHSDKLADLMVLSVPLAPRLLVTGKNFRRTAA